MQAGNKALRDPVAFRCNLQHHWRTGHTYKVSSKYAYVKLRAGFLTLFASCQMCGVQVQPAAALAHWTDPQGM
jgi:hypothetical protein